MRIKKPLCYRVRTSAFGLRFRHLEQNTNKKSLLCKQAFKDFYGLAMIICFSLVPTWLLTIQTHRTTSDVVHAFLEPEYKYQEYSSLEL